MNEKQWAGEKATEFIQDGMIIGLGTGSTVYYAIRKISELMCTGIRITGVSTSRSTSELAESLGIKLRSINDVERIDLTIDGADEVDENLNGIKGGGGALFFEKIVAHASDEVIWVVDSSKMVNKLGKFPLPVEVSPFGYKQVQKQLESAGLGPILRLNNGQPFCTDSHNYIFDLHSAQNDNPEQLAIWLKGIPGVVEHGLFINSVDKVIIGNKNSVRIISSQKKRNLNKFV